MKNRNSIPKIFVIILFTTNCIASNKGDKIEFLFKKLSLSKKNQKKNKPKLITSQQADANDNQLDTDIEFFFRYYETENSQDDNFDFFTLLTFNMKNSNQDDLDLDSDR